MSSPEFISACCMTGKTIPVIHHEYVFLIDAVNIVCLVSAGLSLVAVLYLLLPRWDDARRTSVNQMFATPHLNNITRCIITCDFLACIGIIVRSSVWLAGYLPREQAESFDFNHVFCVIIGMWIQFFFICSYLWNFNYALAILLTVKGTPRTIWLHHVIGWIVPVILCVEGSLFVFYPSLEECGGGLASHLMFNYLAVYVPIALVMIMNPILFAVTVKSARKLLTRYYGRYTNKERVVIENLKVKFGMICLVFYACWIPNVIDGLLDAFSYNKLTNAMIAMWIIKGIMNPLQAFLNCLVFRGWPGCRVSFQDNTLSVSHVEERNIINILTRPNLSPESEPLLSFRRTRTPISTN